MLLNCGVGEDFASPLDCWEIKPKEINPEFSLEGLILKLKIQSFGHLIRRAKSWVKTLSWEREKAKGEGSHKGWRWLVSVTDSMDMNLSKI